MQREPSTAALYIPDEIVAAFLDDARRQVLDSRPAGANRTAVLVASPAVPDRVKLQECRLRLLAGIVGLVGWAALVALWVWLAVQSPSAVWAAIAVAGGIALVPGAAGVGYLHTQAVRARMPSPRLAPARVHAYR